MLSANVVNGNLPSQERCSLEPPEDHKMLEVRYSLLLSDLLYERFGANGSIAVISRAWLSHCYAERGTFTQGLAMAEEGLRVAEVVNSPFSLIEACHGVSFLYLRQGTAPGHPCVGTGHGSVPGLAILLIFP